MDIHEWLKKKKEENKGEVVGSIMEGVPVKKKKHHDVKPTLMQIKAVQYINQGMKAAPAMRKAGYSDKSARTPKPALMKSNGVQKLLSGMVGKLNDEGLTTEAMSIKFKEWINAQKVHSSVTEPDRMVPDYDIQLKTYDRWAKLLGINEEAARINGGQKVKRSMTVTEFVTGEKEERKGDEEF